MQIMYGIGGGEGTFTICSFWLVSALADIGEVTRARALWEKLLSLASPLLFYAEEVEAHTGRHMGNFPQAFSHIALIKAVTRLIAEDERIAAERAVPAAPPCPRHPRARESTGTSRPGLPNPPGIPRAGRDPWTRPPAQE